MDENNVGCWGLMEDIGDGRRECECITLGRKGRGTIPLLPHIRKVTYYPF